MTQFSAAEWYRLIESPNDQFFQGDQFFDVTVRSVIPSQDPPGSWDVGYLQADVIIATQSCDLEQRKISQIEIIPAYPLGEWLSYQPHMWSQLEPIRRGHSPRYYLLPGWAEAPIAGARITRIVAFDEKLSMTWPELDAAREGQRIGLRSPYIEHFGQAVARFYMRVGLPENIPEIRWETAQLDNGKKSESFSLTVTVEQGDVGIPRDAVFTAIVERVRLENAPDVLYKVRLERDGTYFGIGTGVEEAKTSLQDRLIAKYREAVSELPEGKQASNWLLNSFLERRP